MVVEKIRIGVSKCLMGEKVRFDGGHTRNSFVMDTLGKWVEFVPVCPEVEIGLGTPRPTIRLVSIGGKQELVMPSTGQVLTEQMNRYAIEKIELLKKSRLDGFILKKSSPSCGMERLPVYRDGKRMHRGGVGVFAQALMDHWPSLPLEEEGRLNDSVLREHFVERIYGNFRWRKLVESKKTMGALVQFHTDHKMLLLSHSTECYRALGLIVANSSNKTVDEVFDSYQKVFQKCLSEKASPKKHANVLEHTLGYFSQLLSPLEKTDLMACIRDFKKGLVPLVVPVSLFNFNINRYQVSYLQSQWYFKPHPKELALRNYCV